MIFVTVGTHEQQYNRLVECMDKYAAKHNEEVIIQIGYSTYKPKVAKWSRTYSYNEMIKKIDSARIVVTHGGPSSFIMPLQIGKIPVVVPRQKKYNEHVNNHQVDFCRQIANRKGTIIVVEDMEELEKTIEDYTAKIKKMNKKSVSNNTKFCTNFEKIVEEMFKINR